MIGNVLEWCSNIYDNREGDEEFDSHGIAEQTGGSSSRVLRGGSWISSPRVLRSANRFGFNPEDRFNDIGFRVARTLP